MKSKIKTALNLAAGAALSLLLCAPGFAQQGDIKAAIGADADAFVKRHVQNIWNGLKENVNVAPGEVVDVDLGDKLVAKEKALVVSAGEVKFGLGPFTVVSVRAEETDGVLKPIIDLLFGELLVLEGGKAGYEVDTPNMNYSSAGKGYFFLDQDNYGIAAGLTAPVNVTSAVDGAQVLALPAGSQVDFAPDGQQLNVVEIDPTDLEFLTSGDLVKENLAMTIVIPEVLPDLKKVFEQWSMEKINMLQDGMGIDPVVAAKESAGPDVGDVELFQEGGGVKQKTLSFGTSVELKTLASGEAPVAISGVTVNGVKLEGTDAALKASQLIDGAIIVAGAAAVSESEKDNWSIGLAVESEVNMSSSLEKWSASFKPMDESEKPAISGVTVGDFTADDFYEQRLVDKSHLPSGKLEIRGFAMRTGPTLEYATKIVAQNKSGELYELQTVNITLDTSGVERVEVSMDGGSGFEPAELPPGESQFDYSMAPAEEELYRTVIRAFDYFGNESEEQFESYDFLYTAGTYADLIRARFESMMQGFQDEDRSTILRYVSTEFNSDIARLEDANELEFSLEERFRCCPANIQYTISEVNSFSGGLEGDIVFNWADRGAQNAAQRTDTWRFRYEDGEYRLYSVNDPQTFLKPSTLAEVILVEIADDRLIADGISSTTISAQLFDFAGSIVADDVPVTFTATGGSFDPETTETRDGKVSTTYTSGLTGGSVTITVESGEKIVTASLTLNPILVALDIDDDSLTANGTDFTNVTARFYDVDGTKVADGIDVSFTIDGSGGSLSDSTVQTSGGEASVTYTVGKTAGSVTVTAMIYETMAEATITLNPVQAPLPPDCIESGLSCSPEDSVCCESGETCNGDPGQEVCQTP